MSHSENPALKVQFNRRRYGSTTYTWAAFTAPDGTYIDLGDPWPGVRWPKAKLDEAIGLALERHVSRVVEAA